MAPPFSGFSGYIPTHTIECQHVLRFCAGGRYLLLCMHDGRNEGARPPTLGECLGRELHRVLLVCRGLLLSLIAPRLCKGGSRGSGSE